MTKIKKIVLISVILVCSIIGGIGIFTAPASDQEEMKQELQRNEQLLQQDEGEEPPEGGDGQDADADKSGEAAGQTSPDEGQEEKGNRITVIGDSVFLGASQSFKKICENVNVDAKVSRQVSQALDVAKKLQKKGKLGDTVLISLGVNGNFNEATGQALLDYLGSERTVYWINAYGKNVEWQDEVNDTIDRLAKKNDNLQVIRWDKLGRKHPDWFYQDGTHLNSEGQEKFAEFVNKEIHKS